MAGPWLRAAAASAWRHLQYPWKSALPSPEQRPVDREILQKIYGICIEMYRKCIEVYRICMEFRKILTNLMEDSDGKSIFHLLLDD